jgi:gliding motility-associated-like protein
MKSFFKMFFFLIFISQYSFAQLSSFTLVVTKTDETCTGNGSLSFNVQNTTPGATIIYSIYLLPNLTSPLATLSSNSFGGLTSGTYRVVATQSLGSLSNFQQQDYVINDLVQTLDYEINGNNQLCSVDDTISINVLSGTAVSYEIISGPIIYPIQSSNVFTGLISGSYQIRVFDNCGDGIVKTFSIFNPVVSGIEIFSDNSHSSTNCSDVLVTQTISATSSHPIVFPLNIQYTVFHPTTGAPIIFNQVITSFTGLDYIYQYLPLFPNQYYTYDVKVTDACGNIYNDNGNIVNSSIEPYLFLNTTNCVQGSYTFAIAQSVTMIYAPPDFSGNLPLNIPESQNEGIFLLSNLPIGNYTFDVVDVCGNLNSLSYYLSPYSVQSYVLSTRVGCEVGFGSVQIQSLALMFHSVSIISAPPTYLASLPHDVSYNINGGFLFYMNNLPEGQYVFKFIDECGLETEVNYYITGLEEVNDISITENCASFDINLFSNTNATNIEYFLQKYNPLTNQWVHPTTGLAGVLGDVLYSENSILLIGNSINYNFTANGLFRIVANRFSYGNAVLSEYCSQTIYNFEYYYEPKINAVYSFACSANTYDVLVDANGIGNLIYRITSKNGNSFSINNGTNPAFLGLESATYNFQVEDACGNIFNIIFDVPSPFNLEITPLNLCNGQTGTLTVPSFPFLSYQWWKGNTSGTILSTTNVLTFPNLNLTNDAGVYHVRIRYSSNPNSCIDFTIDFTISPNSTIPNAGLDGNLVLCGTSNSVNLFTLLNGTYDLGGVWQEITNSGMLSGNNWLPIGIPYGVYNFKYTVSGFCNAIDESFVSITFNPIPMDPIVDVDSSYCSGDDIQFFTETIPNATYQWTGPNGFTATTQNLVFNDSTTILSGNYTVTANLNGCTSSTTKTILVKPIPQFTMEANCINNNFTIIAIPSNGTFSNSDTFLWSGPDGFTSTINPFQISNKPKGTYSVVITNADGCSTTQSVEVLSTLCTIPNGISPNGDGLNDTFDLSGFTGIREIKIFNRYGMVVYEQENYVNQWHGQQKNSDKLLPDGTYYYLINFENSEPKTGWVYLVREY